ncbi:MAG: DUF427 domain-containing protein [Spirochaetota bacterium]
MQNKESVWDYPRPPRVEQTDETVEVRFEGTQVAHSTRALRVLETSHPPTYYLPKQDVAMELLIPTKRRSMCEFKGQARYYTVRVNDREATDAVWEYPTPAAGYQSLKDHLCFYPSLMDTCLVNGEQVVAQEGDFYGGWITSRVTGPFKGGPGTRGW